VVYVQRLCAKWQVISQRSEERYSISSLWIPVIFVCVCMFFSFSFCYLSDDITGIKRRRGDSSERTHPDAVSVDG